MCDRIHKGIEEERERERKRERERERGKEETQHTHTGRELGGHKKCNKPPKKLSP